MKKLKISPSSEQRSRIMRSVKSHDTRPELLVRRLIFKMGYRYRLNQKDLPGKPDLVFTSRMKVVFVHGCFWHGHDCMRGARLPQSNRAYWLEKISRNKKRDTENICKLNQLGWDSLVIWECELKNIESIKQRIADFLK